MSIWELSEKPRRKTRQFMVRITKEGDVFVTRLLYYGKKPYGSRGYLDVEYTNNKENAHRMGQTMLHDVKRGKFDRLIEEDLRSEQAWRKMGRVG